MRKKFIGGLLAALFFALQICSVHAEGELCFVTKTSLPSGETGKEYSAQLEASGGTAPYTFSLAKGRLPDGLVLDEDGTIHGVPRISGFYVGLNFQVTDSVGASVTEKIKLKITSIPVDFTITDNSYIYDGQEHTATITPSGADPEIADLTEGEDYTVSYGGRSSQSNAGTYNISIIFTNIRYRVRTINNGYLAISSMPATLRASSKTVLYNGERHAIDVTASPEDMPYTVTYSGSGSTEYGPTETPPFAIGTYTAVVRANSNYQVQPVTVSLTINDPREDVIVDFAVTGQIQTYSPGKEQYQAILEPSVKNFEGYKVYYRKADASDTELLEYVTEAGNYDIVIEITERWHKVGIISGDGGLGGKFVLNPCSVSFAVSNTRQIKNGDERKKATVQPSLENFIEGIDYTVTYGVGETASTQGQSEVGEYPILISVTSSNYAVAAQPEKMLVIAEELQTVNFNVSENTLTYDPQQTEYEAIVTPDIEGFTGYAVRYQSGSDTPVEKVTTAGTYRVLISITESGYSRGSISEGGDTFRLLPMPIVFAVSNAERYATGDNLGATLIPPTGFAERYSVYYDNIATDMQEQDLAVRDVGEYRIVVQIENPNYSGTAEPSIFRVLDPITLNYGNSPCGLIMRETWEMEKKLQAKEAFRASYRFADGLTPTGGNMQIAYPAVAWEGADNLDLDDTAMFVYNLSQIQDPGCFAHYSDGSIVPQEEISAAVIGVSALQNAATGVYDLEYSFTDKVTHRRVAKARKVVLLGRIGDANKDKNVNAVDGNFIRNGGLGSIQASEEMTAENRLHLYRVCDVNKDGVVDEADAKAILGRYVAPLIPYYE